MENLLDYNSYSLINAIAMSKSNWLRKIPVDKDPAAKISFEYLKNIFCVEQKDFLKQLYTMHQDIQTVYIEATQVFVNYTCYAVRVHQLLWGRMCVIAHFFYHNHPFWIKGAKKEMISFLSQTRGIGDDVEMAFRRIDNYYKKAAEFESMEIDDADGLTKDARIAQLEARVKELEQQLAEAKGMSTKVGPTEKQLEDTFTYTYRQKQGYSLLIDFLINEAQGTTDIQWARHALAIYENKPSVLQKKPSDFKTWLADFCNLFGRKWIRDYEPQKLKNVKGKRASQSKATCFLPCN